MWTGMVLTTCYLLSTLTGVRKPSIDDKQSNEELLKPLIQTATEEHNEEYGTKLEYVSANITTCMGYYIALWARDLISSNRELKLYQAFCPKKKKLNQAKVCKFRDEISVVMVRPRPTH